MVNKAREVALNTLYKIECKKAYSNLVLDEELKKNSKILNEKDMRLISEIVYGVTTWRLTLDEIIKKYSKIRLKKISVWILNILRMGVYQIVFLDKIPKEVVTFESVNLAKRYGHKASSNFVNAILRKVEKSDYDELFKIEDPIQKISKTTSMPEWIINKLLEEMPQTQVEKICKNSTLRPKTTIRINTLETTKKEVQSNLDNKNIKYTQGELEDFLILENAKNIQKSVLFRQGKITAQDQSAGLSALILEPKPGEKVLDACSSPGGKTTYMAQLMENKGEILALDIHEHRTKLVEATSMRLKIDIIKTSCQDASIYNEEYKEKFDKVLLDVPCLGLGVLKRKPDIKWQREEKDIEEITKIQFEILKNCSKYLKKGGYLVYSTCSILKEENEEIIKKFIEYDKNFEICNINSQKCKIIEKHLDKNKYIKIYQDEINDGFFIAKLSKR